VIIFEIKFEKTNVDDVVSNEVHYWTAATLKNASNAATTYGEELDMNLVAVRYILTVTKAVDEVSDDTTD